MEAAKEMETILRARSNVRKSVFDKHCLLRTFSSVDNDNVVLWRYIFQLNLIIITSNLVNTGGPYNLAVLPGSMFQFEIKKNRGRGGVLPSLQCAPPPHPTIDTFLVPNVMCGQSMKSLIYMGLWISHKPNRVTGHIVNFSVPYQYFEHPGEFKIFLFCTSTHTD